MIDRTAIADAWLRRPPRERSVLAFVAAVAIAALAVFAVIVPLTAAVERERSDLARTEALVAGARAQHAVEATLTRRAVTASSDPATAVASVFSRYALTPLARPQAAADGSVDVVVAVARFDTLVRALDALVDGDKLYVERAVLTALADAGNVRVELRLRRAAP